MMRFSIQYGLSAPPIAEATMAWLKGYSWPGNVREQRNLALRFVIRKEAGGLSPAWLDSTHDRPRAHAPALMYRT